MDRIKIILVILVALLTPSVRAQTTSPTEQPAASSGSLPAGHPDISQMTQTPNSVGAAGSAMPAGVNLPAGHPDISQLMKQASTTQPQAVTGSISIRAVQCTAGGPAIGADSYTLDLSVQGQLFNRVEGKLGAKGTATVDAIPMRLGLTPVVKVKHGGAEYQAIGQVLDGSSTTQEVPVNVYETTDKQPDWSVRMRHLMVERVDGGLQVMEMLAVNNPTDRAWLGNPTSDGKRASFTLTLPAGAQHVQVVGEPAYNAVVEGNRLTNTAAMVPGEVQYQIIYLLPAVEGKADITAIAPAKVQNMIVFLPDDGTTVKAQGIEAQGTADMGNGKQRFYKGADLAAGSEVSLAISGIVDTVTTAGSMGAGSTHVAQIVAGAGLAVILLFGVAFVMLKGPRGASSAAK